MTDFLDDLQIYDISPLIRENLAVFPGDKPFRRESSMSFASEDHLELSAIETTLHIGAHTDAPIHYNKDGVGIDKRPLNRYIGRAQVIEVSLSAGERILPQHIEGIKIEAPRVLFKTSSFPDPYKWNSDFNSCSPSLIQKLAEMNVVLIGIDTPSIDPADDKELLSHKAVFENDLGILEGIVLDKISQGIYTLVALPLNIQDADASPVRAILLESR